MNFDFSDDQKMLREEARRFLQGRCPIGEVRKILDGPEPYHEGLWRAVGEMGFTGTAIPESYGGQGAGYLELCVLAEELGRSLAPVPFSSSIYLATEFLLAAGSEEQKKRLLPGLASAARIGALAWNDAPGNGVRIEGDALVGEKRPVPDGDVADLFVVTVKGEGGPRLVLVDADDAGITREGLGSIDPTRSQARIRFDRVAFEPLGPRERGQQLLERVFDRAAVLFAFEQLGGAQAALEMGRSYALERHAFGRPIGSFQAIKHMLADMYCAVELARSNAYYGAWALSKDAPELPEAAATAHVSGTQAFLDTAKQNIQVHGGMGFTWEFDCHLYYRRAKLLSLVLGTPSHWKRLLVQRLVAARKGSETLRA